MSLISILAGYYIYTSLGGNKDIVFSKEEREFVIQGEQYEGDYNSKKVENIFEQARKRAEKLGGKLAVVNYGSDVEAKQVSQFIGVILINEGQKLEANEFEIRSLEPLYVIKAKIEAHNLVMPKPGFVRSEANEFDAKSQEPLSDTTIEIYSSERELHVYFLRQIVSL